MIHTVTLKGLRPGARYKYKVDNDDRIFNFQMPREVVYPYRVGLTADVGQTPVSNSTMHLLAALKPEVVLWAGDLSYADGFIPRWDSFGILFEPLGARVPVMFCPGNHEAGSAEAYKSFNVRYPMPYQASGSTNPNYWSRNIGPMHVISLDSYSATGPTSVMYRWLERDLAKFSSSRGKFPWLIVMFHAPFYNSNKGHLGEAEIMKDNMEELLYKHGVDLVLAGHVHSYERTNRVYKNKTNPCGPVYVNLGDGGNREGPYHTWLPGEHGEPAPAWTAFRQGSFGVGHLTIMNISHAKFEWNRNACFDGGEIDFNPADCSTDADNSNNAMEKADEVWVVRSGTCLNKS